MTEVIAFENYDEKGLRRLEYNLTDNTYGEHYGEKHKVTVSDKMNVLKLLDEYIGIANGITKKHLESSLKGDAFCKKKKVNL